MLDLMHLRTAEAHRSERTPFACSKHSHCDHSLRAGVFFRITESRGRDTLQYVLHRTLEDRIQSHMNCLPSSAI
jgi:hypothetical protein